MQRGVHACSRVRPDEVRAAAVGGERLDELTRRRLERSFDTDLSVLRVHTDGVADRLTRAFHTDAFAAGPHLFFRTGAYHPRSEAGLKLLAHEVTHTLQQACRRSNHHPSGAAQELEAEQAAARVADGRRADLRRRPARLAGGLADGPLVIQRHEAFEHRILGDLPAADIYALVRRAANFDEIIERETQLMWLWHENPELVSEADISTAHPGVQTLRLHPSNLLMTYGELTALPDFIASFTNIFTGCPKDVLLPILQTMRQDSYYRLNTLRGKRTDSRFAHALTGPGEERVGMLNKLFNSAAMEGLTDHLDTNNRQWWGIEHYLGQLARNACHFAPHTWYRWQSAYLTARDIAKQASDRWLYPDQRGRLTDLAWLYHGYAQHFLHDSFATGNLLNKTLVMQWFVEWAAAGNQYVEDWDPLKYFNVSQQPHLAGQALYDASYLQQQPAGWPVYSNPSYTGPGTDPQTAEESGYNHGDRAALSGVQAYERLGEDNGRVDQDTAHQHYLTFLSSVITQAASFAAHDTLSESPLWVASEADPTPYQLYGDNTFLAGPTDAVGARITAETAQASRQSIIDLLTTGETTITTEQLRQRFPTRVGSSPDALMPLEAWAASQRQWTIDNVFTNVRLLDKRSKTRSFPRIVNVSEDNRVTVQPHQLAYEETPMLGEIKLFPYEFVPEGWAACDGALMSVDEHAALYSLLGTAFGGDGQNNFALPNLTQAGPLAGQGHGMYCIAIFGLFPPRK